MATCAACSRPIVTGQEWGTQGTEIFHRSCLRDAYRSKLRVAETEKMNALAREADVVRQLAETRRAAARVETEANQLRNELAGARAKVLILEGQAAQARSDVGIAQERAEIRLAELQGARNQVVALQAEIAKAKPEEVRVDQDEDASATRFKMLELD